MNCKGLNSHNATLVIPTRLAPQGASFIEFALILLINEKVIIVEITRSFRIITSHDYIILYSILPYKFLWYGS